MKAKALSSIHTGFSIALRESPPQSMLVSTTLTERELQQQWTVYDVSKTHQKQSDGCLFCPVLLIHELSMKGALRRHENIWQAPGCGVCYRARKDQQRVILIIQCTWMISYMAFQITNLTMTMALPRPSHTVCTCLSMAVWHSLLA